MPWHRTNDAVGVSDCPRVATSESRIAELVEEYQKRLRYVAANYERTIAALGTDPAFTQSLKQLRRAVARERRFTQRGVRAHPEIEIVINHFAREHARDRAGLETAPITQRDTDAGARKAAEVLATRQGARTNRILRHHVEGLMALIHQFMGLPVVFLGGRDGNHDPQPSGAGAEIVLIFFKAVDPQIKVGTLASIVKDARRKFAGHQMRFCDFFPLYGLSVADLTDDIDTPLGSRIRRFEPNVPIYFP